MTCTPDRPAPTTSPDAEKRQAEAFALIAIVCSFCCLVLWIWWSRAGVRSLAEFWKERLPDTSGALTMAELGQAGDIFGGISSLFSVLAFITVAIGAYYQRQAFILQRDEACLQTRLREKAEAELVQEKAMRKQQARELADETKRQLAKELIREKNGDRRERARLDLARRERFDALFFRMLGEIRDLGTRLVLVPGNAQRTTHDPVTNADIARREITDEIQQLHQFYVQKLEAEIDAEEVDATVKTHAIDFYKNYYKANSGSLGPLFRNLFHTFDLISKSGFSYREQCEYARLTRASLDEKTLQLLMLNGISRWGQDFFGLINKYGLLKHLDPDATNASPVMRVARSLYPPEAFAGYALRAALYQPLSPAAPNSRTISSSS